MAWDDPVLAALAWAHPEVANDEVENTPDWVHCKRCNRALALRARRPVIDFTASSFQQCICRRRRSACRDSIPGAFRPTSSIRGRRVSAGTLFRRRLCTGTAGLRNWRALRRRGRAPEDCACGGLMPSFRFLAHVAEGTRQGSWYGDFPEFWIDKNKQNRFSRHDGSALVRPPSFASGRRAYKQQVTRRSSR